MLPERNDEIHSDLRHGPDQGEQGEEFEAGSERVVADRQHPNDGFLPNGSGEPVFMEGRYPPDVAYQVEQLVGRRGGAKVQVGQREEHSLARPMACVAALPRGGKADVRVPEASPEAAKVGTGQAGQLPEPGGVGDPLEQASRPATVRTLAEDQMKAEHQRQAKKQ